MKVRLETQLSQVPPRGSLADAIRYALTCWDAHCRFLNDGRLKLDTNTAERAIRPVAMTDSFYTSSSSSCKH
jgi:transposase